MAELFALVIDLARVEQTAGNKALLGRARAVLSYRLDALRAPRPPRTRKSDTSDTSDIEAIRMMTVLRRRNPARRRRKGYA